jgi:hypothetical protein
VSPLWMIYAVWKLFALRIVDATSIFSEDIPRVK